MLVQLFGSAVYGVDAHLITIEVNIDKGIGYHLVGLPDNAIKESKFEPLLINTRAIFKQQLRFPELDFADVK